MKVISELLLKTTMRTNYEMGLIYYAPLPVLTLLTLNK